MSNLFDGSTQRSPFSTPSRQSQSHLFEAPEQPDRISTTQASAISTGIQGAADIATGILQGAFQSSATEKMEQLDIQQQKKSRENFLAELAENEKENQENFKLRQEQEALQARDQELNTKLKRWTHEFSKAMDETRRMNEAAGRLTSQLRARPDIAQRINRS